MTALVGLAWMALFPGCLYVGGHSKVGQTFVREDLASLEVGVTTRRDMLALFGPPHEYTEPEVSAALLDDELRLDRALDVARRSQQAWTWQGERVDADGTWLLVFGGVWAETENELLVAFFDDDGVLQHVTWTLQEDES